MSHATLTARYRPQRFSELAGQETVRAILSRAAAEDRVAPAYLFSGTRGVGKTTVARIFAKALNCLHAPAPEPCNVCERCRQITAGTAVDVVEIDGASNRGIDDVRRLKEVVGYAPMDARYKVFIIDEAHMLSREAFNALLKTLEEPPSKVTFIMATTEAHKFPATILSRCQHYVFKGLSESGLETHLASVLEREKLAFEEGALRLIARRAAGSVRDGMSLLGQVLAFGGDRLTEENTRRVLGLAGQELLFRLFAVLRQGESVAVSKLTREMLEGGLDIGFFLRELAACWRSLFLLLQSREQALPLLDMPPQEATRWLEEAALFDPAHVHAAWQMTLDGQRRVLTSLEPGLALELLLLNLALLPRLLPLEQLSALGRRPGGGGISGGRAGSGSGASPSGREEPASGRPAAGPEGVRSARAPGVSAEPAREPRAAFASREETPPRGAARLDAAERTDDGFDAFASSGSLGPADAVHGAACAEASGKPPVSRRRPGGAQAEAVVAAAAGAGGREQSPATGRAERSVAARVREPAGTGRDTPAARPRGACAGSIAPAVPGGSARDDDEAFPEAPPPEDMACEALTEEEFASVCDEEEAAAFPETIVSWSGFMAFCAGREDLPGGFMPLLSPQNGEFRGGILRITPGTAFAGERIAALVKNGLLGQLARAYAGRDIDISVLPPAKQPQKYSALREEMKKHPSVMLLEKHMGARVIDCGVTGG